MTTRDRAPVGAPCWIDLATADPDVAVPFYCQLFGWEAEEPAEEFGGYRNFTRGGERIAGCMRSEETGPGQWSVYLAVDDAAKTVEAAAASGGQVIVPAMQVADLGTMAVLAGPDGAVIGLWQPGTHPGFLTTGEHGAPGWFELHTSAYDTALGFYRSAFGWDTTPMSDSPEFRYTIVGDSQAPVAGVVDDAAHLPEGGRSSWATYFWVDDTDAAVATLERLGGRVLRPAEDTPYGRLAGVADPNGVPFHLMGANEMMPARG